MELEQFSLELAWDSLIVAPKLSGWLIKFVGLWNIFELSRSLLEHPLSLVVPRDSSKGESSDNLLEETLETADLGVVWADLGVCDGFGMEMRGDRGRESGGGSGDVASRDSCSFSFASSIRRWVRAEAMRGGGDWVYRHSVRVSVWERERAEEGGKFIIFIVWIWKTCWIDRHCTPSPMIRYSLSFVVAL